MRKLLYGLIALANFSLLSQETIQTKLNTWVKKEKPEKVYLHLDRPNYGLGESIWLKAYVVDGSFHEPTLTSGTLYVDLINLQENKVVDSLILPIQNGSSSGNFNISKKLAPGRYRIRSYTNWMRNFDSEFIYRQDFNIWSSRPEESQIAEVAKSPNELFVDFFPEGGELIDGIAAKTAIKVSDQKGNGIKVQGTITDNNGNEITSFSTNSYGHGLCFFKPTYGIDYSAQIESQKYQLPDVMQRGAAMRINHSAKSEDLSISLQSNGIDLLEGQLIGHQRGKFLFGITVTKNNAFSVKIRKQQLPPGIIHVTFFTKGNIPITERLVFPNIPELAPGISINPDKESYDERSKVTINLEASKDTVIASSITVHHKYENVYPEQGRNMVNYLLLSSDLKGKIESPNYYFTDSAQVYKDLDLLMLTQGWSRFEWEKLINQDFDEPTYFSEQGITIAGEVKDYFNKKKSRKAKIGITIPTIGVFNMEGLTDENGQFIIKGNEFYDSTRVIITAHGFKGKKEKKDEYVSINLKSLPALPIEVWSSDEQKPNTELTKKLDKLNQIARAYNLNPEATLLDEVVVTAQSRKLEELQKRTTLYVEPSNRIIMDSLNFSLGSQSIFEILRTIPGVQVSGTTILIRGPASVNSSTTPLFVVDGIIFDDLSLIPVQDIEVIDVLKGADASVYGTRGANGVILVYTRKGSDTYEDEEPRGIYAFDHPGYHISKKYFTPQYDVPDESHAIPDYRSTLFWEDDIVFEDGKAQINFFTSDQPGIYRVRLEGLLKDGTPIFKESEISVE